MGQKAFPDAKKLRFIIAQLIEGKSDNDIQEALESYGPAGAIPRGKPGIYGAVGSRTLLHVRSIYHIAKELLEPRFVRINDSSVQKAKDEHLAELKNLMEGWRDALRTPAIDEVYQGTVRSTREIEKQPLFPYLKEHLPSHELWQIYGQYTRGLESYLVGSRALNNWILNDIRKWLGVEDITANAARPILRRVRAEKQSGAQYEHDFAIRSKSRSNVDWMFVDGYKVLRTENKTLLKEQLSKYSDELMSSNAVSNLVKTHAEVLELEGKIKKCLDGVLFARDYVISFCSICPDIVRIPRTEFAPDAPDSNQI